MSSLRDSSKANHVIRASQPIRHIECCQPSTQRETGAYILEREIQRWKLAVQINNPRCRNQHVLTVIRTINSRFRAKCYANCERQKILLGRDTLNWRRNWWWQIKQNTGYYSG